MLPRVVTWVDRQPISEGLTAIVLFITLVFAWSAEVMGGLAAITGAFIAGVGLGRSHLRDKIESKMRVITYGFLVPIFFVSIGLEANLREITGALLPFLIVLFIVAVLSKVIGAGLGARLAGLNNAESLRVGVGMISRGEVGLIVAGIGVREAIISPEVFTVVVVLVLLTTLVTPLLLRYVFPRPIAPRRARPIRCDYARSVNMPKLIVAIVTDMQVCHDVIHLWEELGVPGATILDSIGMRHLKERQAHRDDLPLMPSLRSMLEQEEFNHRTSSASCPTNSTWMISFAARKNWWAILKRRTPGCSSSMPVLQVRGLRRHTQT